MENNDSTAFSFVDTEHRVLDFWKKNDIFKRSLQQTEQCEAYVFYDGPPFATGLPHHGHLLASTIKDVIPRYFTMQGRYVERRFGWDCHGLPIEHEIDKSLGISAQEAVAQMGVRAYNNECRSIVQRYASEWEKTITRLGRWVDFENDYKTMDPWFMESVWWGVKQLWDKDLIYQGEKVVPFSTALGTVLSNFEASSNYQDVQDPAVTVLFKLKDEDCYVAAWTTTPWTLPSNLGLCVGASIDYVKVRDEERQINFILARARLEAVGKNRKLEVIGEMSGADLVGRRYEPLFPYFREYEAEGAFRILADDYVSTDSGTGVVHIAPGFGVDDFRIMKAQGIKGVCPIDVAGRFTAEVTDYAGQYVKDADKEITRHLKQTGHLYHQDVIVHSYPFCPRSDTPILYRTILSWYVKVESMRDQLVANNQQIYWVPDHIKNGRMGNWLEGAVDWAISRNRYWGTPLPIWVNDLTGKQICIGSRDELFAYSGVRVDDIHRDHVDDISFAIDGEEGSYRRIGDVLDCWFESGSMPFAQLHYPFENKERFETNFPAEFIAEGIDQTRGWFYTLAVLSNALFGKPAFKNVIVNGIVMADDGKKMSKRLRNYTPPDELMESYGADALRLYLINSKLVRAEEQNFSDAGVQDMVRRALLPWLNAFKFMSTYADIDKWKATRAPISSDNILDQWILSKLQSLKYAVTVEMQHYRLYNVVPALFNFIEELTNWYIRLNRPRFWVEDLSADKLTAYEVLFTCVYELSLSMAPFAPFLSEHVYQQLRQRLADNSVPESVHLCRYPESNMAQVNPSLEKAVELLQNVIVLGRQKRNQEKIKTRIPLARLTVIHRDGALLDHVRSLEGYIKDELNVKSVEYCADEQQYIDFYAKPNLPVLGKKLGKNFGRYKGLIEGLNVDQLNHLEQEGEIALGEMVFNRDEILLFRQPKDAAITVANNVISISMDCTLDENLLLEGMARELVNRIQKTRKEVGLNVEDRIRIVYSGSPYVQSAIEKHAQYISSEALAVSMIAGDPGERAISFKINDDDFSIALEKASA